MARERGSLRPFGRRSGPRIVMAAPSRARAPPRPRGVLVSRSDPAPLPSRRQRRATARMERPPKARARPANARRPAWRSPLVLISAAALVVGVAVVAAALPRSSADGEDVRMPPTAYEAGLANGNVLGAASAPVVIQVYADFQCPAC